MPGGGYELGFVKQRPLDDKIVQQIPEPNPAPTQSNPDPNLFQGD